MGRGLFTRMKAPGVLAFAALALAACGGGGGAEPGGTRPADPVMRLEEVLEVSDTLLVSGFRTRYRVSGGGETLAADSHEAFTCAGARCVSEEGAAITAADLAGPDAPAVSGAGADFGSRGGFDTAAARGTLEVTESVPGVRVRAAPTIHSYGFWGEHGHAALELGSGPLTGEVDATAFTGEFAFARAYAAGEASGANPAGAGSATWRGIVEASPVGAFERLQGTVTVTIADLAQPRVGVAVDVPGHEVDAPGWADVPLAAGRFATGTAGSDYLAGSFHGPRHEEAWGVFDTKDFLGAFGAKRARDEWLTGRRRSSARFQTAGDLLRLYNPVILLI